MLLRGKDPVVKDSISGELHISWPLLSFDGTLEIILTEDQIKITITGDKTINWYIDLAADENAKLPFERVEPNQVTAQSDGMHYVLKAEKGSFSKPADTEVFRLSPVMNSLILKL